MAAQGRDIKLSTARVEGYRNFATKLWNAARFAEMNECVRQKDFDPKAVEETVNRWIAGEVERTAAAVTAGIEAYKFNEAAGAIYEFTWGTFCDWYLELTKPILNGEDDAGQGRDARHHRLGARPDPEAAAPLHAVHHRGAVGAPGRGRRRAREPAVPLAPGRCSRAWPMPMPTRRSAGSSSSSARCARCAREMNVPAGAKIPLVLVGAGKATRARAEHHEDTIERLARLDAISFAKAPPKGSAQIVLGETTAALPLAGVIDMGAERTRLDARDRQVAGPRSARSTPSWRTRSSSPRRRPRWWRRTASAAPTSRRPCASCRRR